jgi:UPF0337 protein spr1626
MKGVLTMSLEQKIDQAKGSVKENVGKVTGDKKLESEGVVDKTVAKVKDVAEDIKDAVEGTIEGVKNAIDNDDKK